MLFILTLLVILSVAVADEVGVPSELLAKLWLDSGSEGQSSKYLAKLFHYVSATGSYHDNLVAKLQDHMEQHENGELPNDEDCHDDFFDDYFF